MASLVKNLVASACMSFAMTSYAARTHTLPTHKAQRVPVDIASHADSFSTLRYRLSAMMEVCSVRLFLLPLLLCTAHRRLATKKMGSGLGGWRLVDAGS